MRKTLVKGTVAAALVALGVIAAAGSATAAETAAARGEITRDTSSYSAPTTYSPTVSTLTRGQQVTVLCSIEGQRHPGDGSPYWFRVRDERGDSFVPRVAITPPADTPSCQAS